MRAISAGLGFAECGKDSGCCINFFKAECNFVTSRPHPTPSKACAHFLPPKKSRGAWLNCQRNSSSSGCPSTAVCRSTMFLRLTHCLKPPKAAMSSGCSRLVLQDGTKRSCKPCFLAWVNVEKQCPKQVLVSPLEAKAQGPCVHLPEY